jgi:histidinol-phosphate aminotransferase
MVSAKSRMKQHSMVELAAPGVRCLRPYASAKITIEVEREYGVRDSINLASNENPLGVGALAREAILRSLNDVGLYPDGNALQLKARLARHHDIPVECITLGNGSNDILVLLAAAFLTAEAQAVYSQFCFAIYPLVVQAAGAQARTALARPVEGQMPFGHDLEALFEAVTPDTRLVFIANPNNPTGTWLGERSLRGFLHALPRTTLAVVDEAYFEYSRDYDCPDVSTWLSELPNLLVVRTFSKAYGLAGLRVGYCLSDPNIAEVINRVRQPFNVSSIAQAAAAAALDDHGHLQSTVNLHRAGLQQLRMGLQKLGVGVPPTAGNFVLVDTHRPAAEMHEKLQRQGVIVRPLDDYGLMTHLRVTVGTAEQNERFLGALARILA